MNPRIASKDGPTDRTSSCCCCCCFGGDGPPRSDDGTSLLAEVLAIVVDDDAPPKTSFPMERFLRSFAPFPTSPVFQLKRVIQLENIINKEP